jgi:3-carboxy-cis,cis-muconate cycloisomerase
VSSPGLFDEVLARGGVRDAVSDPAWLRALLDAEAGLAWAQAAVGLLGPDDARFVVDACKPDRFDIAELSKAAAESGNPVVALVARLRELAPCVHKGATSQDILDTASMLVADRALEPLLADLTGAAEAAAALARQHRDTAMAGRTLLQQAAPITFGLKAARWLSALHQAVSQLTTVRETRLAVQLGGPTGTLGAVDLIEAYAATLGLVAPSMPWHTDRTRIGELAAALGIAAGTVGKIARDVTLLSQNEVAEVAEATPGGSSSMPHKRNPAAAVSALACAAQAPGLVATLLAAMVQEHERAAGAWQSEWRAQRELLISVGSAAAWLHTCLAGLRVDRQAIAANLAQLTRVSTVDGVGAAPELVDRALAEWEAR